MQAPLAYRVRPVLIENYIGLDNIINESLFIYNCINQQKLFSMIFFGTPGTGKTTLAICLANSLKLHYRILNATVSNKKDLEIIFEEAKMYGHLIVIIDEIHRLNKDRQDFLLSYVESGLITLIGTTTANPYHSINPAIRSRCHLIEFKAITSKSIISILKNAAISYDGLNNLYQIEEEVYSKIAKLSGGDIRYALNCLEILSLSCKDNKILLSDIKGNLNIPAYLIDKDEDGHYDAVSALQKSIRGSDVDAALYYLARLIAAQDLDSIERRLTIIAYEDIGLANPAAVDRTINAIGSARLVGFPEAAIPLGFIVCDLALSPKSKSACEAIAAALEEVEKKVLSVPKYLSLTPHNLKDDDKYPYDRKDLWEKIQYLPELIKDITFYQGYPSSNYEKALLENNKRLKSNKRSSKISELR